MTCPTDARLRAHVDVADGAVDAHIADCGACARQLRSIGDDQRFAAAAIAGLDDGHDRPVDVESALQAAVPERSEAGGSRIRLPLSVAAGVVALLVASLAVLTPTGRQAAADFLAGFRSERFEVVTFDPEEPLRGVERLDSIAQVDVRGLDQQPTEVADLAGAATVSGFDPTSSSTLPAGATLEGIQASAPGTVELTFDADHAPDLPAALDGSQLVVSVPGAVVSTYQVDGTTLIVGESGQLSVEASGADLAQIRQYVLSRPEVPRSLADQLLAIDDWTTTVPIPVPVDAVVWQDTTVGDAPALQLSDPMGSGLLWQADGRIHAVGGEGIDIETLHAIADGVG